MITEPQHGPATRPDPAVAPVGAGPAAEPDLRPGGPAKRNVLGVLVDAVEHDAVVEAVVVAARGRRPFALSALAVHGVMTAVREPRYRARLNTFDAVTPDGQPVRWALNLLYRAGLRDWVSGPELMIDVLRRLAGDGLPVYLYGSTPDTLRALTAALHRRLPTLAVAGAEPSRFRPADPAELRDIALRIRRSGARLVLVGLGCPRQETFAHALRPLLPMPVLAVGAAFDYHAGRLRRAPLWMRRHGLSWLWRLAREPRRLWRRYLLLNPAYLAALLAQRAGVWRPAVQADVRDDGPGQVPA